MNTGKLKLVNKIYIFLLLAVAVSLWIINAERMPVICLIDESHSIDRMFYVDFLAPSVITDLNKMFGDCVFIVTIILFICTVISNHSMKQRKNSDALFYLIYICGITVLVGYIASFCYELLCLSWIFIIYAAVALAGLVIVILSIIKSVKAKRDEKSETDNRVKPNLLIRIKRRFPWGSFVFTLFFLILGIVIVITNYKPLLERDEQDARYDFGFYKHGLVSYAFALTEEDLETNLPYVKVCFVNAMSESGIQYSYEELVEDFKNYRRKGNSWDTLWDFCQDSLKIELKHLKYNDNDVFGGDYYDVDDIITLGENEEDIYYPFEIPTFGNKLQIYYIDFAHDETEKDKIQYHTYDVLYFGSCVERNLNSKGLTLVSEDEREKQWHKRIFTANNYQVAQREDIEQASIEVAKIINTEYEFIHTVAIDFNQLMPGDEFDFTNNNNDFVVNCRGWEKLEEVDAYGLLGCEGVVEDDSLYRVSLEILLPLGYYTDEYVNLQISGLDYEKIDISFREEYQQSNKIVVDMIFAIGEPEGIE